MSSIRINFFIPKEQYSFLKEKTVITLSEHIRKALDDYILKLKDQSISTSASQKGGNDNG